MIKYQKGIRKYLKKKKDIKFKRKQDLITLELIAMTELIYNRNSYFKSVYPVVPNECYH
jgi:transposase